MNGTLVAHSVQVCRLTWRKIRQQSTNAANCANASSGTGRLLRSHAGGCIGSLRLVHPGSWIGVFLAKLLRFLSAQINNREKGRKIGNAK